jgi:DNA-binding SARP family transcriptional activator
VASDDVCLSVSGNQLKLTMAPRVFVDVFALEASVRDAAKPSNGSMKAALSAIVRETLIDILSDGCEGFLDGLASEWVLIERERLFNLQIRGLSLLMHDLAESGRIEEALDYGRRILRMDPMRECVQRQVMWLHVLNGHQGNAIRQYLECARILKKELGVTPMPETRALYEFIVGQHLAAKDLATHWRGAGRAVLPDAVGRAGEGEAEDYDEELTRLRSLLSRLNSHRQSVFSALAESG